MFAMARLLNEFREERYMSVNEFVLAPAPLKQQRSQVRSVLPPRHGVPSGVRRHASD